MRPKPYRPDDAMTYPLAFIGWLAGMAIGIGAVAEDWWLLGAGAVITLVVFVVLAATPSGE